MWQYLMNIWESVKTPLIGMRLTWKKLFVPAVTLAISGGALGAATQFSHAIVCQYGRLHRLYPVRTGLPGAVYYH